MRQKNICAKNLKRIQIWETRLSEINRKTQIRKMSILPKLTICITPMKRLSSLFFLNWLTRVIRIREIAQWVRTLFFQRTWVWFPVYISDCLHLSPVPAPGEYNASGHHKSHTHLDQRTYLGGGHWAIAQRSTVNSCTQALPRYLHSSFGWIHRSGRAGARSRCLCEFSGDASTMRLASNERNGWSWEKA